MTVTQTVVREFEVDLVVREAEQVAHDVVAMTLSRPDGAALPDWTPGAHIDLLLGDGLTRQYSLCGRTSETDAWRVAVLKAPDSRGGSQAVHELGAGATVRVRGPRNHFPVVASKHYLFVAGGIGITPLLAMIYEVEAAGAEWELHYGGRTRKSMAFLEELEAFGDRVHVVPEDELGRPDLDAILGAATVGHPRLHLRSRAAARRCGGALRCLAVREPAPRAVHGTRDRRAGRGELLRAGPAAHGQDAGGARGPVRLRRGA